MSKNNGSESPDPVVVRPTDRIPSPKTVAVPLPAAAPSDPLARFDPPPPMDDRNVIIDAEADAVPNEPAEEPDQTQRMRRFSGLPIRKILLGGLGVVAAVALVVAILTYATGSGSTAEVVKATPAAPPTAAPAAPVTDAQKALDLANGQAKYFNAEFLPKLNERFTALDGKVAELENKVSEKDAEIRDLRRQLDSRPAAVEPEAAPAEETDPELGQDPEVPAAKPPTGGKQTDDLVVPPKTEVDPFTMYPQVE